MRFWGGIFLLVVVGIGVLFWRSYRKAMGPPPTRPGKSPEFDKHLAEINDKWLFLFYEDEKILVDSIHGNEAMVLIDITKRFGEGIYGHYFGWEILL